MFNADRDWNFTTAIRLFANAVATGSHRAGRYQAEAIGFASR